MVSQALISCETSEQLCEHDLMRIGADMNQARDTMRNAGKNVVQMNTQKKVPRAIVSPGVCCLESVVT